MADTRGRDAARYFRNQALTLGSNLDPGSQIADQIASQNANMFLSATPGGIGNAVMAYNGAENLSRINSQNGLGENLFYGGLAALNFYGAATYPIAPPAWTAPAPTLRSIENSILVNAAYANDVAARANVPRSFGRFGTAAHQEFEAANVQLNSELSGSGFRVAAEEFRNASGGVVTRRAASSLGVDAVVYKGTTPVVGFDLKTGAGWGVNTVNQVQS